MLERPDIKMYDGVFAYVKYFGVCLWRFYKFVSVVICQLMHRVMRLSVTV